MKKLVLCFFCFLYASDPLVNFQTLNNDLLTVHHNNGEDVYINEIYVRDNKIYVVLTGNALQGVIEQYDLRGNIERTLLLQYNENSISLEAKTHILWEEEVFYVPGLTVQDNEQVGVIQKYTYNALELVDTFGDNGTLLIATEGVSTALRCITVCNNKYFAAGYEQVNREEGSYSGHIIIDFDGGDGTVNHRYHEAGGLTLADSTRTFMQMYAYTTEGNYYIAGKTFDNKFAYVSLNPAQDLNMHSITARLFVDEVPHTMLAHSIVSLKEDNTQLLVVDNEVNRFLFIEMTLQGNLVIHTRIGSTTKPFNSSDSQWISSMDVSNNTLFVSGEYLHDQGATSLPFVMAFDITNPEEPSLNSTFFNAGRWVSETLYEGNVLHSVLRFITQDPYYSLLLGYRGTIKHLSENVYLHIKDLSSLYFIPFVS